VAIHHVVPPASLTPPRLSSPSFRTGSCTDVAPAASARARRVDITDLVQPARFAYDRTMVETPSFAAVAALVAEPARARMLTALMDGRALTATELALAGGVAPSTASSHLARLTDATVIALTRQGRHRYYRIATADIAMLLEALMSTAPPATHTPIRTGPSDEALRRARVCYDHLAGEAAVRLLDRLQAEQLIRDQDGSLVLTTDGDAWCGTLGIDLDALRAKRRPLCRSCLDWSERRPHLAGALGAALLEQFFTRRWARRVARSRAVILSPRGESFFEHPRLSAR
jgi:DNA-binding transcriptional ArsR family regulator